MTPPPSAPDSPRTVSGRVVVLSMIGFGLLCSIGTWTYWKLHLAPFMPLQQALQAAFPKSYPRVEGGRHKQEPPLLRVVMQVPFAPVETDDRVAPMCDKVIQIIRQHIDLSQYDDLEIYLVRYQPEAAPEQLKREWKVRDIPPRPAQSLNDG